MNEEEQKPTDDRSMTAVIVMASISLLLIGYLGFRSATVSSDVDRVMNFQDQFYKQWTCMVKQGPEGKCVDIPTVLQIIINEQGELRKQISASTQP